MTGKQKTWLTVPETVKMVGVSRQAVQGRIDTGKRNRKAGVRSRWRDAPGPHGGYWEVKRVDVEAWAEERQGAE